MARPSKPPIKHVEVLVDKNGELTWMVLVTASEDRTLKRIQDMVIMDFTHEGNTVQTVFNLDKFLAYSIVG